VIFEEPSRRPEESFNQKHTQMLNIEATDKWDEVARKLRERFEEIQVKHIHGYRRTDSKPE